ncbi:uncharacterized protein DUF3761 [Pseudoduganella flava]|uniref:DUF3761 domain-containing protein n=1 Tax=Pseudoduganella flava TaxID=871742 RepID=A0A562PL51_9BURK|nr:DUF3761 domain-containing protein [Pseudoduganella flava]QGZ42379.1 DUF3761 domain-containing protein [Pseudoduganella flava]TWI44940.1 uncharacterized protein DUF3761 [Pseudoduganella flava]
MHKPLLSLLAALAFALPAQAQYAPPAPKEAPVQRTHAEPNEQDLQQHGHYRNSKGDDVHSPAASKSGKVPDGASAQCRDGTYSFSRSRRGTCSHHGGVATWL